MQQSPSWEANRFSASQEITAFYGNRRFITAFTQPATDLPILRRSIQSMPPHPTSWRSILISSTHLRLVLQVASFPQVSQPKPYTNLVLHIPPISFFSFNHPSNIRWGVQIIKLLVMQPSPLPCYLVPLNRNYSPQYPILKNPQPTFSLNMSDQVSHPYTTKGKIVVLYVLYLNL